MTNDFNKNDIDTISHKEWGTEIDFGCFNHFSNFENKTIEQLKEFRKRINLTNVNIHTEGELTAYLIRMIDILIDRIDQLEQINE